MIRQSGSWSTRRKSLMYVPGNLIAIDGIVGNGLGPGSLAVRIRIKVKVVLVSSATKFWIVRRELYIILLSTRNKIVVVASSEQIQMVVIPLTPVSC